MDFPLPVNPHVSSARSTELQCFVGAIFSPRNRLQLRRVSTSGGVSAFSHLLVYS